MYTTSLHGHIDRMIFHSFHDFAVFAFAAVQSYLFRHPSVRTIFYPSRFVRRYLAGQKVQQNKMELLTRGVNTEMFLPSRRNDALRKELAPNGEIILVTVSRIAGEKGFDFLAKVAKELDARGFPFKLVVVGGNRNADVEKEVHEMFDMRLNSHSRLNLITALLDAIRAGADEALMLDPRGHVSSCNATNLFWVRGGRVETSAGAYCFNGVTRANVIALCRDAAIPLTLGCRVRANWTGSISDLQKNPWYAGL